MLTDFPNIEATPGVVSGRPRIKGTRLSVEFILSLIAGGSTIAEIVQAYPQISEEQVKEAVQFAIFALSQENYTITNLSV